MGTLHDVEGKPVHMATIKIVGAGDGLSKALAIDPEEYHQGDRAYVVLECTMLRLGFEPVSPALPSGPQVRVHTFKAGTAAIVERSLVGKIIDEQARVNKI